MYAGPVFVAGRDSEDQARVGAITPPVPPSDRTSTMEGRPPRARAIRPGVVWGRVIGARPSPEADDGRWRSPTAAVSCH
jgi:hypothetical protein